MHTWIITKTHTHEHKIRIYTISSFVRLRSVGYITFVCEHVHKLSYTLFCMLLFIGAITSHTHI